jgi:hypothetical protein
MSVRQHETAIVPPKGKAAMSNGIILYRGPSMLDGAPIIVVATGLDKSSKNDVRGVHRVRRSLV